MTAMDLKEYGLDLHCTMILEEYRELLPTFRKMEKIVKKELGRLVGKAGLLVSGLETRIKTEASLAGKLELKGAKYRTLEDVTDILGARVITFYSEEVDKIASLVDSAFEVDWNESVDKRKQHALDSFGYDSLHYICRIPKSLCEDPSMPELNNLRFEIQMRTALQHVWATINHDTGYKSGIEVPKEYLRNLNRIAGMLELADEQFSLIRSSINDYRRKINNLVENGKFEEVELDGDSFRRYLELDPFERLTHKIALINQAEIQKTSSLPYLKVMKGLGFQTLADVEKLKNEYEDDAYQLALSQLGGTDIDIIVSSVALQDLLTVYILRNGGGEKGLAKLYSEIGGSSPYNDVRARQVFKKASSLPFMRREPEGQP